MAGVSFSDMEDAFLFVGSAPYGTHSAYLNVETGQIFYRSEMAEIDEISDEDADWDRMIEIPHKNDLDLGRSLVFEFAETNLPDEYGRVRDMFRHKGAYSRFKELLAAKDLLEAWYRFEEKREHEALRSWCEEHHIPVSDQAGPGVESPLTPCPLDRTGTSEPRSTWQSKEVARLFLEGVRGAIPGATLQLEVLSKIVNLWCPHPSRILDLGCGDGVLGRMLIEEFPAAHVVFADFSEPMLDALRERIGDNPRASVIHADFSAPAWAQGLSDGEPLDVVVSGFAIHHQPDRRKKELYAEIYGCLVEGGLFLNLDHVSSATPSGKAVFDSLFVDHLLRFHRNVTPEMTRREVEEVYYLRPDKAENILAPVGTQCQWLRRIGFQDVDCFFKVLELALFGGRKASKADAGGAFPRG